MLMNWDESGIHHQQARQWNGSMLESTLQMTIDSSDQSASNDVGP
jgi:hypothetical protein